MSLLFFLLFPQLWAWSWNPYAAEKGALLRCYYVCERELQIYNSTLATEFHLQGLWIDGPDKELIPPKNKVFVASQKDYNQAVSFCKKLERELIEQSKFIQQYKKDDPQSLRCHFVPIANIYTQLLWREAVSDHQVVIREEISEDKKGVLYANLVTFATANGLHRLLDEL